MASVEQSVFSFDEDEDEQFEVLPRLTRQQRGRQTAEVRPEVVKRKEEEDEEKAALDRFLRDCGVENIETMSWDEKEQYANVLKESKQTCEQEEKARKFVKEQSQYFQGRGEQSRVRGQETGHESRGQSSQNSHDSRRISKTGRVVAEGTAENEPGAKNKGVKKVQKGAKFKRIMETEMSSDSEFGPRQEKDQNAMETISDSDETTDLNANDATEQSQREQLIESTFTLRPEGILEQDEVTGTGLSLPLVVISEDTDSAASGVTHRSRFASQDDTSSQGQSVQAMSTADQSDSQDLDTSQTTLVSMADVCIQASLTSAGSWSEDSTDEPGKGHPSSGGDSPTFDSCEKTGRRTPLLGEQKISNENLGARGTNATPVASPDLFSSQAQKKTETLSDEETQIMDYGNLDLVDQDAETQDVAMETATNDGQNGSSLRGVKRKVAPFEGRDGASPSKRVHLGFDLFDPNPKDSQTPHAESIMKPLKRKYHYKYRDQTPLFAPSSEERRNYTAKIVHFFEEYRQQLRAAQSLLTQFMTWGEPVYTGAHMPGTLDVFKAGARYPLRARSVQTPGSATGDAPMSPASQPFGVEDKETNQGSQPGAVHPEGNEWNFLSSPVKKQADSQPFTSLFDFQDEKDFVKEKRAAKESDDHSSDPDFMETFSSLQKYRKKRPRVYPAVAEVKSRGDKAGSSPTEESTSNRPKKRAKKNKEEVIDNEDREEPGLFEDFPSAFSQLKQAPSGRGRGTGRGRGRGRGKKSQPSERGGSRAAGKGRKVKDTEEVTIEDDDSDDDIKDTGAPATDAGKPEPDTTTRQRRTLGTRLLKLKPVSETQTPAYDPKDFLFKLGAEKRPPLRDYGRRGQAVGETSRTSPTAAAAAAVGRQQDAQTHSQGAETSPTAAHVDGKKTECPICQGMFLESEIQDHCEGCIVQADGSAEEEEDVPRLKLNLRKRLAARSNEGHTGDARWQSPRKTTATAHSSTGVQLVPETLTEDVDFDSSVEYGQCPVCQKKFASTSLVQHANYCLEQMEQQNNERQLRSSPRRLLPLATAPLATTPVQDRKTRLQKQLYTVETNSDSDSDLNLEANIKHTWSDFTSSDDDDTLPTSANQEGSSRHMTRVGKTPPVKLPFQRISEQKDTMIDFHNQFKTADPKTLERKRNARMRRGRKKRTKRRRRRKPGKKDLTQKNKKLKKL